MQRKQKISAITFFCFFILVFVRIHYSLFERKNINTAMSNIELTATYQCSKTHKQRLVFFFGTRPEAVKMSPIIKEATKQKNFEIINVFTGQHKDIILPFIIFFNISIHYNLDTISYRYQSVSLLLARIILNIETHIPLCENDIWVVQGDTTTALAASIVAFSRHITIAHVEAGLRTYDVQAPFPEEFNRRTISLISKYNFVPSELADMNLQKEGVPYQIRHITGNPGIDTIRQFSKNIHNPMPLNTLTSEKRLILVTMHRRENFAHIETVLQIIESVPCTNCIFILPLHPNNKSANPTQTACLSYARFHCVSAMTPQEMYWVFHNVYFIMTDSGGIQEEASWFQKPILILRDKTERMESVHAGISVLVGHDKFKIEYYMTQLLSNNSILYNNMSKPVFPYGDGFASEKILRVLSNNTLYNELKTYNTNLVTVSTQRNERNINNLKLSKFINKSHDIPYLTQKYNNNEKYVRLCTKTQDPIISACSRANMVGVVLTVYKRQTLSDQLLAAASQTLKPLVIHVHHNDNYISCDYVKSHIDSFQKQYTDIRVHYTHYMQNSRFHTRFFTAYMLETEYVSIWDDDQLPEKTWLEKNIQFSIQHSNALTGGNARNFKKIRSDGQIEQAASESSHPTPEGYVDFVGHVWTLRREYIRFFLADIQYTYYTGEDIQLSFSLQKRNIPSFFAGRSYNMHNPDTRHSSDKDATFRTKDLKYHYTRNLLFCQVLQAGFKPRSCENCNSENIEKCIQYYTNMLNKINAS